MRTVSMVYRDSECAELPELEVEHCAQIRALRYGCQRFALRSIHVLGSLVHVSGFAHYPADHIMEHVEIIRYRAVMGD